MTITYSLGGNSSLDKIEGGFALEQNRPLVENWGYDNSNFYHSEH